MSPATPPWPSLYDPAIELVDVAHKDPVQPHGAYLYDANDIFRYTFYWMLIFYVPLFVLCGLLAFANIVFAPTPQHLAYLHRTRDREPQEAYQLTTFSSATSPTPSTALAFGPTGSHPSTLTSPGTPIRGLRRSPPKVNPYRTRAVFALLVLLAYLAAGLLGAVVGSAVIGYLLAALYKAGKFNMSTWIPPLFALLQTLIGILGVYPSIVEIM